MASLLLQRTPLRTGLLASVVTCAIQWSASAQANGLPGQPQAAERIGPNKFWQSKIGRDFDRFWSLGRECEPGQCIVLARVTEVKRYPPPPP